MSLFDEILAIKQFRETQAEIAVVRERQRCVEAERESERAQNQLMDFRLWAESRERDLYRGLYHRVVQVRDIEHVLQEIASLRTDEESHEAEATRAKENREQAGLALQACRDAHRQTVRMSGKFLELTDVHMDSIVRLQDYNEDIELEEIASLGWERVEWGEHEEIERI